LAASKTLTPAERTQRARLAALRRWSQEDPTANAKRAQAGLLDRFRREILAEQGDIAEPELTRRAVARRREHMTRLAFNRSRARQTTAEPDDETAA
jgi:hypothetical protein